VRRNKGGEPLLNKVFKWHGTKKSIDFGSVARKNFGSWAAWGLGKEEIRLAESGRGWKKEVSLGEINSTAILGGKKNPSSSCRAMNFCRRGLSKRNIAESRLWHFRGTKKSTTSDSGRLADRGLGD